MYHKMTFLHLVLAVASALYFAVYMERVFMSTENGEGTVQRV